jgi:hypothetical protein
VLLDELEADEGTGQDPARSPSEHASNRLAIRACTGVGGCVVDRALFSEEHRWQAA